jgi:hypothetical protein
VHTPAWQASTFEQALPSSHADPSGLLGLLHCPVAGSQAPASWHSSSAAHATEELPAHAPALQRSTCVHASPSSHAVPVKSSQSPSTFAPAAAEHASHAPPSQALEQHTPSTQKPLSQSPAAPHAAPGVPDREAPITTRAYG